MGLPPPRKVPLTKARPRKNSTRFLPNDGRGSCERKDHLPRWTKIEATSMAIVDPIFADNNRKIAAAQIIKAQHGRNKNAIEKAEYK
jgi:hypothetical protein